MAEKSHKEQVVTEKPGTLTRRNFYDPQWAPFGGGLLGSPFSMMRRMMDEFDRSWAGNAGTQAGGGLWSPAIEVSERDGKYTVTTELPGIDKADVRVEATQDALIIEGERKHEKTWDEASVHRSERSYGRFHRSIPLPDGAEAQNATAKFENGVLEVSVPMTATRSDRKQIPVSTS